MAGYPIAENTVVPQDTAVKVTSKNAKKGTAEKEFEMSRCRKIGRWIGTMTFGCLSLLTCCCFCCGACGKIRSPRTMVLYDDDDNPNQTETEKQMKNGLEWSMMATITLYAVPTCGCCGFGCCGLIGPMQATECISASKTK